MDFVPLDDLISFSKISRTKMGTARTSYEEFESKMSSSLYMFFLRAKQAQQ